MAIKDSLLPELDHELATTRRLLERVPGDFDWKPHAKSMSLGQLAGHIANLSWWGSMTLEHAFYDVAGGAQETRLEAPKNREELLQDFDRKSAALRARLTETTDAEMMSPWTLKHGSHEIFTMPRISTFRSFVMNHMIHHRGQLSVYLRLKDVPLPSMYGPTADEQ
jgi:uncharacterized damage-inducible protein DinB